MTQQLEELTPGGGAGGRAQTGSWLAQRPGWEGQPGTFIGVKTQQMTGKRTDYYCLYNKQGLSSLGYTCFDVVSMIDIHMFCIFRDDLRWITLYTCYVDVCFLSTHPCTTWRQRRQPKPTHQARQTFTNILLGTQPLNNNTTRPMDR